MTQHRSDLDMSAPPNQFAVGLHSLALAVGGDRDLSRITSNRDGDDQQSGGRSESIQGFTELSAEAFNPLGRTLMGRAHNDLVRGRRQSRWCRTEASGNVSSVDAVVQVQVDKHNCSLVG